MHEPCIRHLDFSLLSHLCHVTHRVRVAHRRHVFWLRLQTVNAAKTCDFALTLGIALTCPPLIKINALSFYPLIGSPRDFEDIILTCNWVHSLPRNSPRRLYSARRRYSAIFGHFHTAERNMAATAIVFGVHDAEWMEYKGPWVWEW